jgi:hypothetical protein
MAQTLGIELKDKTNHVGWVPLRCTQPTAEGLIEMKIILVSISVTPHIN